MIYMSIIVTVPTRYYSMRTGSWNPYVFTYFT